jgi:hypothetical protein
MPTFNSFPRLQSNNGTIAPPLITPLGDRVGSMSPNGQRSLSPAIPNKFEQPRSSQDQPPPTYETSDGKPLPLDGKHPPSGLPPNPGAPFIRPSVSAQPYQRGPSFGPNVVIPPARSTSFLPGPSNDFPAGPSFIAPNPHYGGIPFNGSGPPTQQQMYPLNPSSQAHFPQGGFPPPRPPSEPSLGHDIRKSLSVRSLGSQYSQHETPNHPPLPSFPPGQHPNGMNFMPRNTSFTSGGAGGLHVPQERPLLPSAAQARAVSMAIPMNEPSPPNSPVQQPQYLGPVVSTISAQMKCKVFLQQHHAQWKSLGSAKLKLYRQEPTNIKQLVVEADNKDKSVLISTIVLTDGVERVGKTGVAIELSDKGARTGIVYMIQLRNETSAGGLFDSLLAGSDRATRG